jgi:hypothetical protein
MDRRSLFKSILSLPLLALPEVRAAEQGFVLRDGVLYGEGGNSIYAHEQRYASDQRRKVWIEIPARCISPRRLLVTDSSDESDRSGA